MAAPPIPPMELTGGAGGSAGPSSAQAGAYGSGLNSSGWQVNFSGMQTAGLASGEGPGGVPGLSSVGGVPWWVLAIVAGVVVWRLKNSRR
jgi:hypothetical protein